MRTHTSTSSPSTTPTSTKSPLYPLILLLILVHLSTSLYTLPLNRVIERRLCQDHYAEHDRSVVGSNGTVPEKLCKIDEVQRGLAWLQGMMETVFIVCDAVATIPFSFIAERYGVRVVLWCNLVPLAFMSGWALVVGNFPHVFPTQALILGPFTALLGGECVFSSTVFTLTSALAGEYVQRASYFSYISSTTYIVNFIGPTLASFTMSQNLWLPFWLNLALLLLAVPTIHMLPAAAATASPMLPVSASEDDDDNNDYDPTNEAGPLLAPQSPTPNRYSTAFSTNPHLLPRISHALHRLTRHVTGRRNFQTLLLSFFLTALASSDTKLLVRYISKRYEWTFAQAGYMLSAKALVNFALLALVVPRIIRTSMASTSVHGSEIWLNYLGAQASIAISVLGVLCVALAFKFWLLLGALVLYALGSALPVFTMSLVKSPLIARSDSDMQDFSIVMLVKTMGSLVGAPLMTVLWVQAIRLGGAGIGLPYFVSAGIYVAAAVVVARLEF
ncbi:hypothetical protein BDV95DRAFT_558183 [Massariosphaeria phaeospora]|uniref:Major facilitator superfamily domain-containing protein n=1 Tax=Massariosphaeria phaeospora TaxID=100035 RepID=A0A7C8IDL3_9PLEO|nr:hypothetical protein BDV95DRAFT_558183 [Massariosphaeria phaeospora]